MTAPPTTDLAAWLTARLDEDEAAARRVDPLPEHLQGEYRSGLWDEYRHVGSTPARVLATVAAMRRIVELHAEYDPDGYPGYCGSCGDVPQADYPCPTLKALASIYADADGFDPRWAE